MDTRSEVRPGAPYRGWRGSLPEPRPRPLAARLRPYVRALFHVLAVVAGIAVAAVFYRLPILAVTEASVQGNAHLSAETVRGLADVVGANMLAVDIPAVQQRLQDNPWIAGVRVRRRLPATVEITLSERTAGAVWQAANGRFLVATDGTILEPDAGTSAFPVIVDGDGGEVAPGQSVSPDTVALAYRLIEAAPNALGARPVSFEQRAADGLVVQTDNGWRAAFGDSADFDRKLAVWRSVAGEVKRQGVKATFVDLRFGDRPYVR